MSAVMSDLIDGLVADLKPVPRHAVARRLALGVGAGAAVAAAAMLVWLGPRPDMPLALAMPSFWIKAAYTLAAAGAGFLAIDALARPGGTGRAGGVLGLAAFLAAVVLAVGQLAVTAGDGRRMLFGGSAGFCPVAIVLLAVPIFAGALWSLRGLAPTRPRLAGAGAGLLAGSLSAFVYSFSCQERGLPFLASWYTLGIVLVGILGAAIGPRLLRW